MQIMKEKVKAFSSIKVTIVAHEFTISLSSWHVVFWLFNEKNGFIKQYIENRRLFS